MQINNQIINQKGTPAFFSDIFANRPAFGYAGRVFISTDTGEIYEDTGTSWTLIADAGAGTTGTLQQVTTNGSSTTIGLSTSGNGIGIGTTIPASNKLDIHSASGINATFNGTTTNNAALQLQNAGTGKWNIQNLYNAGANSFQVYDVLNSTARLTILNTGSVGIGITNPTSRLEIFGGSLATGGNNLNFSSQLTTGRTGTYEASTLGSIHNFLDNSSIEVASGSTSGWVSAVSVTGNNGTLFTGTVRFTTQSAERMRITSTGIVLIGSITALGASILQVTGAATFTGALSGTTATFATASGGASVEILKLNNSGSGANTKAKIQFQAASTNYASISGGYGSSAPEITYDVPTGIHTFNQALSGTSATFSSSVTATAFIPSGATIPTNGMYLSAANTLNFATASTNAMTLNASGQLGVKGTATLAQISLGISTANTTSSKIAVYDNIGSNFFGIGLTSYSSVFGLGLFSGTTATGTPQAILTNSGLSIGTTTAASSNGLLVNGRGNFLNATDNALFSLNSGGTLYTVGFSPTATANSTNTLTLTTAQTTWIYTGTGLATWTLPTPSGTNQMFWIKNAGTGIITLNAFAGTNIIDNSATSVSSITIAVGATALIQQDGNVKSYQLQ